MIRFLFLTLFGIIMVFAILITMSGGMLVLREAVKIWFDVDFFKIIEDKIRGK